MHHDTRRTLRGDATRRARHTEIGPAAGATCGVATPAGGVHDAWRLCRRSARCCRRRRSSFTIATRRRRGRSNCRSSCTPAATVPSARPVGPSRRPIPSAYPEGLLRRCASMASMCATARSTLGGHEFSIPYEAWFAKSAGQQRTQAVAAKTTVKQSKWNAVASHRLLVRVRFSLECFPCPAALAARPLGWAGLGWGVSAHAGTECVQKEPEAGFMKVRTQRAHARAL
jgi:hypothetical protein